ncbi:MAG: ParB/RepB/Spo0J family partition protein [Gordonia sp. (in: high G+C Gram-positive bacteria)]
MAGFQVMPRLTSEEYAELEASIVEHGVQVPITVAADGVIVDGHHRDEIARKHDLHCPRRSAEGSAEQLRGLAFSLNLHRRHLTREQKRQIVAESIKADPQLSDREHGRRTGVDHKTAATVRDDLAESGEIPHFSERIDPRTGNASQPASKPRPEPTAEPGQDWIDEALADGRDSDGDRPLADEYEDGAEQVAASDEKPSNEPIKPRRKPLEAGFFDATMRLAKVVTSLQNLGKDDRLTRNKEQVARYRHDLLRAIDQLQLVADQLK